MSTSSSVFESRSEHRAFAFFQHRTSQHLSGLVESEIWSCILLQVARADPSIRHAIIALASVHEEYEQTGEAHVRPSEFALRQYNRAIRCHIERAKTSLAMKATDLESYLAACVVFICIEMLQSHPSSAVSLIKQAVNLFQNLPAAVSGQSRSTWPVETFEALLCQFQSMAVGLVGRATYSGTVPPRIKAATMSMMPKHFSSVNQAKEYFDFYLTMFELSRPASYRGYIADPPERGRHIREAALAYRNHIANWSTAFLTLKRQLEEEATLSERDRRTLLALDIRRKFLTNLADITRWDACTDTFNEILDSIESILCSLRTAAPFTDSKQRRVFTLELGTTSPLFIIARGCRDPVLRRRAIRLLRQYPICEGLWDSLLAANIAARIVELEETAADQEVKSAADVPSWARLPGEATSFDVENRRMVIRLTRGSTWTRPGVEEFVSL